MANILLVDDDEGIQKVLKAFLEKQGFGVMCASTGEEALQQMEKRPALVLLDNMMPDMHGLQVLNRMMEMSPATPVIMVTGLPDHAIGLEAMQRGAVDFVTTPVDFKHFLLLVDVYVLRGEPVADA